MSSTNTSLLLNRGAVYSLKQYDHFKNMMETTHNKKERKKKRDRRKLIDVRQTRYLPSYCILVDTAKGEISSAAIVH